MGAVAEAFAAAYAAADDRDSAITWYQNAMACNDASGSMKVHEQLGNLQVRRAWARVADAATDAPGFADVAEAARQEIQAALRQLQALADMMPTLERHSLCGSACKRLAMLEDKAGDQAASRAALADAAGHYGRAETIADSSQAGELFYPALNRIALDLVAELSDRAPVVAGADTAGESGIAGTRETSGSAEKGRRAAWPGLSAKTSHAVRASLLAKSQNDPNFWSYVGLIDLAMLEAVAQGSLAAVGVELLSRYDELHGRVTAARLWESVADQARWVLSAYAAVASPAEAAAAVALRDALMQHAKSN